VRYCKENRFRKRSQKKAQNSTQRKTMTGGKEKKEEQHTLKLKNPTQSRQGRTRRKNRKEIGNYTYPKSSRGGKGGHKQIFSFVEGVILPSWLGEKFTDFLWGGGIFLDLHLHLEKIRLQANNTAYKKTRIILSVTS